MRRRPSTEWTGSGCSEERSRSSSLEAIVKVRFLNFFKGVRVGFVQIEFLKFIKKGFLKIRQYDIFLFFMLSLA